MPEQWIEVHAGSTARRHLEQHGLTPADIGAIPAAAGGPKGLALLPLDRLLAREWLPRMHGVELMGASIGAWRMAALAQTDPLRGLDRLQNAYVREQNYPPRPTPAVVATVCREIAHAVLGQSPPPLRSDVSLSVITARAQGPLVTGTRVAFARAAVANTIARQRLATHLQRVVFRSGAPSRLDLTHDPFGNATVDLTDANREDALLASGSIPLVCDPVRNISGAPAGDYWDGGLIDYHLLLPYPQLGRLVLYPHFVPWVTPGWLDKGLRWRARPRRHGWLANVILISPSAAMLKRLPDGRLPDRQDFYRYGTDHASRIRSWERAIAEVQRFADAALAWLNSPDLSVVRPL
jgi:Patatin-like phospholipase